MSQQQDVIDILTHDRREAERMFAELESLQGDKTEQACTRRKDLTDQVTIELVRHSLAEQADVYPAVKKGQRKRSRTRQGRVRGGGNHDEAPRAAGAGRSEVRDRARDTDAGSS